MGRIPKGINGPVKGKVAHIIGSSRNGVEYIKGPYKKQTKPSVGQEAANQNKFSETHKWLQPLLPFLKEGFSFFSKGSGAYNMAKSNLLLNAFENGPDGSFINPEKVNVSYGSLPLSANIAVEQVEVNVLKFSWDPAYLEGTDPRDQVMMLAYDLENRDAWYIINGQFRKTGSDLLEFSKTAGKTYHIYMAFTSADRTSQSSSVYLGEISV